MSPFFAAIFLLGLSLANAIKFTTVYEWDKFDFVWPSGADTSIGQLKDEYKPGNVYLSYMAVFGERLFLSLDTYSGIPATLVWLPTSGSSTAPPKLAPFPSWHLHKKDNCDSIQAAKGMKTDTDGRLWVLDDGNKKCPAKIWIFNLLNHDTTERVHQFPDTVVSNSYIRRELREIVLEKTPDDYIAYITDAKSENIVVYSRKTDKSWSIKTPRRKWESLALSANKRQLYLSRFESKELYSVSVSELKKEGGSAAVKFIGEWAHQPYRMLIDSANVMYAAFYSWEHISKWNISQPFHEQRLHEVGRAFWPFTFALDTNGTFWMTQRNQSVSAIRHKLLKAAVSKRSNLFSTSAVLTTLAETSGQQQITTESSTSSLRVESTPPPSLTTGEAQNLLGVFFINLSPQSKLIGKTQPRPQSSISLPFLILLQTCHCVAEPEIGKNANLFQAHIDG